LQQVMLHAGPAYSTMVIFIFILLSIKHNSGCLLLATAAPYACATSLLLAASQWQ
jgi:hypothetical protein